MATSTVEAEFVDFHEAALEAIRLQQLLHEMLGRTGPIVIICDSTGCIANLKNPLISGYIKHVDKCHCASKEMFARMKVMPGYTRTGENVADMFTKPLVNIKFTKFR